MSVNKDEHGRRYVHAEIEVPGTPEEVWRAIATGPGITSWFVPSEVDERVGGEAKCSFGPGMDSISVIKELDAPRRMLSESQDLGPEAPPVATEWIVEAQAGDTCIVRVVHSLFTDSDEWDNELEAWEAGWPDFFRILSLYLENFAGQHGAQLQLSAMTTKSPGDAWAQLCAALGASGLAVGEDRRLGATGLPAFDVHVEHTGQGAHAEEFLMRASEPTPGLTHWFALQMGAQTVISMRFYVFGADAEAAVARVEPQWQAWISSQFPSQA